MELGAFSVSLAVKDLGRSKKFYENLGFSAIGGDPSQSWLILRNGDTTIGLFQGMLEKNTLTFNPGWDKNANSLENFHDIRELQKVLKSRNIPFISEIAGSASGPASFIIEDPDGNPVLFDQHV